MFFKSMIFKVTLLGTKAVWSAAGAYYQQGDNWWQGKSSIGRYVLSAVQSIEYLH